MKVAFLFPLHDEEKRIQLTLKFIKFANKNFKNHKFVFLLNNCKDKTEKIINIKFKKIRNKIILKSKIKNRGAGLNKAFKKLKVKYFAVCAVDNAWDFNFYKAAYKLLENGKAKIVFGPKSHPKSIVKRSLLRKIISFLSMIFIKIFFTKKINFDCQCIKFFRSDLNFLKKLNNYNYFSETEFALMALKNKVPINFIPIKIKKTKHSKINFLNLIQYCFEAIEFRLCEILN